MSIQRESNNWQRLVARRLEGARCLVTGGGGFIGSNLCSELVRSGAHVCAVDSFVTGKPENLPRHDRLNVVEDDICSAAQLPQLVASSDLVFHLAAQVGNIKSIEQTESDAATNIMGSVRLFRLCRGASVRKVVYSSSSAGYGEAERIPIDEQHPQRPASFYALSKMTAESYAHLATSLWQVPIVSLRYFNVFGLPMEYNEYTGVISIFFDRLSGNRPLVIYGDGSQYRDFVHVDDVVQANVLAALDGEAGQVFNIGTGDSTTITQLAETMRELTGRKVAIEYTGFRSGEVRESVADISRAKDALGYAPSLTVREGLSAMWRQIQAGGGHGE